mgnify:CR=1 FL=1
MDMDNNEQLIEAGTSSTLDMDRFSEQTPEAQVAEVLNDIIRITNAVSYTHLTLPTIYSV